MSLDDVRAWFVTQFGEPEILAVAPVRDILAFARRAVRKVVPS